MCSPSIDANLQRSHACERFSAGKRGILGRDDEFQTNGGWPTKHLIPSTNASWYVDGIVVDLLVRIDSNRFASAIRVNIFILWKSIVTDFSNSCVRRVSLQRVIYSKSRLGAPVPSPVRTDSASHALYVNSVLNLICIKNDRTNI